MNGKMVLRRSSRLIQNTEQGKSVNYSLAEKTDEDDDDSSSKKRDRGKKKYIKNSSAVITSTDDDNTTEDSDYDANEDENGSSSEEEEKGTDDEDADTSEDPRGKKARNSKSTRKNGGYLNNRKNRNNNGDSDESSMKEKRGKNRGGSKKNHRNNNEKSIIPFQENSDDKEKHTLDEGSNNLDKSNKQNKQNKRKNKSYIDRLHEDIDDDDFDIFKKNSKFDRNKRISTSKRASSALDINLKKRKSIYVESSNSEDSSESDDEYTNEKTRPSKKLKKNNNNKMNDNEQIYKSNISASIHKNFEDFNLYEKIKKGPPNLHEIIEEIYYNLFNRENNEKVKISTFFLNFLAECSGNETLTWTIDIIDYIDKQVYLYEEITNDKNEHRLIPSNNTTVRSTSINEIITPSTAQSGSKIINIDEIIKDENSFEKVCTFKCEKLEQYLPPDLENDVLIKSKNENNKSYKAFTKFFSDFSYHFDENYIYEVLYICTWIFSLSVSKYRKLRFTASLASHSILLGLCKKINYINNHEKQVRKQLLSEYIREMAKNNNNLINKRGNNQRRDSTSSRDNKNGNNIANGEKTKQDIDIEELIQYNKKRDNDEIRSIIERNLIISQLIDNICEDRKSLTVLNNFLLCTYNILYRNKIKDVFLDIRVITLEYFHHYLQVLNTYFTNRKFTKLLIWILYDKDNKVKICSLNILTYFCTLYNANKNFKIVELLYMCKKKLLNLIFDNDYNVRMKTFELILQMSKMRIRKIDLIAFKKRNKRASMDSNNRRDLTKSSSSSQYDSNEDEENDTFTREGISGNNQLAIIEEENHKKDETSSDIVNILSKREKKIVSNLIWFNNNNKISKIITSLIYESQIKNKIKQCDKKRNNYFDVEQNDANCEIVKYNIIYLTKYLNKNIPTVKNFVHYFDYLTNYNENMKLYTVIDKFVTGIREKLDAVNCIDVIIELLCKDDISPFDYWEKCTETTMNNNELGRTCSKGGVEADAGTKKKKQNGRNTLKEKDKKTETCISSRSDGNDGSGGIEASEKEQNDGGDVDKPIEDRDLRKCLLYICESSYRNFQNDINELEKNKNRKSALATNSTNVADRNSMHTMKLSQDTNKIKKMIIYTFGIIKNSKLLIKLHQTNQEHLLLVFKILKIAIQECKHIYKNDEKNNIYNFSSTIMEYFKNDIDSNINFFQNNVFLHIKDTYEYLYYLLKNFNLPYYSSKYTMNMISMFLSLNEFFKRKDESTYHRNTATTSGNYKLSTDLFFDLYYTYFTNFLEAFSYYRKNYNAEIECEEDEEEYIKNGKNKVVIVNESLVHKDRNIVDSIENDLTVNLTKLIHMYTLCFNYINNNLSSYVEKKNDIKKINKSIKKVMEHDYFQFIVNEKCQSYYKENTFFTEFLDETILLQENDHFFYDVNRGSREKNHECEDDENVDEADDADKVDKTDKADETDEEEDEEEKGENYETDDKNVNSETHSDQRDEEYTTRKANSRKENKKSKKNKNRKPNGDKTMYINRNSGKNNTKFNDKVIFDKNEDIQHRQHFSNLYYSPDACMHANVVIQLCLYIIRAKINSVYYYEEEKNIPITPSSRLLLLCIDLIYVVYENYIYYLCKKRYFFNYIYNNFFLKNDTTVVVDDMEQNKNGKMEMQNKSSSTNLSTTNEKNNKNKELVDEEKGLTEKNKNEDHNYSVNIDHLKNLPNLSERKKKFLKNIFIELNYIYNNIVSLRDDLNDALIYLIKASNNTILKYGTFLNLMNVAQMENVFLYSIEDMKKYKTVEVYINLCSSGRGGGDHGDMSDMDYMGDESGLVNLQYLLKLESSHHGEKNNEKDANSSNGKKVEELVQSHQDINDEINKYKSVSRYVYKEDNVLFNFVTELFKNVENINNDNYNFVNSFLSIDIGIFFPINTYTYIADMCKIYNKDELSMDEKILEMQYMHMSLIIAQFILHCNNINIFNSCLGVLLLIHLNVKNKGLSSIALNFHNKLKKYNIEIFYEVLLCALIGLYTAYINNALEEKDLLLFSTSIASRLGVKILEKQKLPLCKFIHSCVNCALNLKNQNSFLKYILPYAQKLNLSDYQLNYLKKQMLNLIESYNTSNNTQIKFENSIFEHMILIICKKRKLNEEFKDSNYEQSYMSLNESIHLNISKNITRRVSRPSDEPSIKTRRSFKDVNTHLAQKSKEKSNNVDKNQNGLNTDSDDSQNDANTITEKYDHNDIDVERNQSKHVFNIKEELIDDKDDPEMIAKSKKNNKSQNKKIDENDVNNQENALLTRNKTDSSDYEKTQSNSTLSNFISPKEDDDNIYHIEGMNYGNNGTLSNDKRSIYEIESSPKPIRGKKITRLNLIDKKDFDSNIYNEHVDKSPNALRKNSEDQSLNSSLNDISDKDNDDISIISERKDKMNYFEENDDDSNSDIIPGMSPMKTRKKRRSDASTPISYADDLMNF